MAHPTKATEGDTSGPPRLRPTWTTWMWLAFAVLVVVLTTWGLLRAGG
jgi:hypothetical protein